MEDMKKDARIQSVLLELEDGLEDAQQDHVDFLKSAKTSVISAVRVYGNRAIHSEIAEVHYELLIKILQESLSESDKVRDAKICFVLAATSKLALFKNALITQRDLITMGDYTPIEHIKLEVFNEFISRAQDLERLMRSLLSE